MHYRFNPAGSLDIGGLLSSYPEIDGVPIRPVRASAERDRAVFTAPDGELELTVREEEGGLCLNCKVCTFPNCGFGK